MYLKAEQNLKIVTLNPLEFYKEFKNDLRRLINVIIKDIPTNEFCISLSMTLKECTNLIEKDLKRKLTSSNLTIPYLVLIFCLVNKSLLFTKIHKSGIKVS